MSNLILLVDDSVDDTRIFTALLRKSGVENPIHSVLDGKEAIAYLSGDGIYADREKYPEASVMILDLRMPQMDGFQVLEWIKPREKRLLIIVLSVLAGAADISRAYHLGAHTFLTKPCHPEEIANLIRSYPDYWMLGAQHWDVREKTQPRENGSRG